VRLLYESTLYLEVILETKKKKSCLWRQVILIFS